METREQHEEWARERRESWAKGEQETTATAVVDDRLSYVISGMGTAKVTAVPEDLAKLLGEQRVRIEIGPLTVFVTRDAIPALISQLLAVQAMTPVSA